MQQESMNNRLRDLYSPDFSKEVPEVFLADLEEKLDQRARKKRVAIYWKSLVFVFIVSGISLTYFLSFSSRKEILSPTKPSVSKTKKQKPDAVLLSSSPIIEKRTNSNKNPLISHRKSPFQFQASSSSLISNIGRKIEKDRSLAVSDSSLPSKSITENELNNQGNIAELAPIVSTDTLVDFAKKAENDSTLSSEVLKVTKPTDEPKIKKWNFQTGFGFGMSYVNSSFKISDEQSIVNAGNGVNEYREKRQKEERAISSIDFNFYQFFQRKSLVFGTGFSMFQFGEQIRYEDAAIFGENRYSYFSLPVYLGFEKRWSKFSIMPFMGAHFSWSKVSYGRYLSPNFNEVTLMENIRFVPTISAQVQFSYMSESGFGVNCSPYVRRSIIPAVEGTFSKNSYLNIGMEIGVFYRFF
ncbi:MAG: hypothetical protein RL264_2657 [Bacteroidota bacterium]|jgi:hypothetical protein